MAGAIEMNVSRATGVKLRSPGIRKGRKNDRREERREDRGAGGHGLSRHGGVRRGGEKGDPFRRDTIPGGQGVCA